MDIEVANHGHKSNDLFKRIKLIRGDITKQNVDAIVTLIPEDLEYRGTLNTAILEAAGEQLDEFVLEHIYMPHPGDVYALPGFGLAAKHVLFGIRPAWKQDFERHDRDLINCVRKSMELSQSMFLKKIAIPLLGSGDHGFPKSRAARLILQAVKERMTHHIEEVRLLAFTDEDVKVWKALG